MWLRPKRKPDSNEANDESILAAWRAGDRQALGTLFERHAETVYGVCLFYFRNRENAKDAVMQIFESLTEKLRRHDVKQFRAWLSAVTRNHCISELRKSKPGRILPEAYLDFELRETSPVEEEKIAGISESFLREHLEECIDALNEKQRRCVLAFYIDGMSYEAIATRLNYAPAEVKSYIQNGKRNLKILMLQKMKDEGRA